MRGEDPINPADPDLPPRLREAIARLYDVPVRVPPEVDERVLSAARAGYARRSRSWRVVRWIGGAAAAAAVVALAVRMTVHSSTGPNPARPQVARVGDVNGDGKVDILDSFVVARRLADKQPVQPTWDVNGDGVVDQKDVDFIAHMAV